LFGDAFVLLAAPEGNAWCEAAHAATRRFSGLPFEACLIGGPDLHDPGDGFAQAYGLSKDGAVLVRPDGFVACRARDLVSEPQAALERVLNAVLMKTGNPHAASA